ncbi:MAG: U32 family peptidase [Ruminococcaceae bacterium]|nr:U32 family peptidase [Oscillospiraceae bacterium]
MTRKTNATELLSPAGNFEALIAAVQNGADAVYLGGTAFSARAGAGNFDDNSLIEAVKYCHVRGVKVFVTLNTLIKQTEFEKAAEFAHFLHESGVDGIIVQDAGLAAYILACVPDIRLHGSTQMTVHNIEGAKKLEKLGFKRVVLARELSLEQIRQIRKNTNIELEIFVHGAICCSYSGQCLFSSFLGGRSGNRGRCAQPCRLFYELQKDDRVLKKGYLLSPKDMCLLAYMDEIKKLGIESLKIEGRLKRPEYVATVTKIYRKYLDNPKKPLKEDTDELLNAFNRSGFTDAYFTGNTGGNMMSFNSPSNISEEIFNPYIKKTFSAGANFRKTDVSAYCTIKCGEKISMTLCDSDDNAVTAYGDVAEKADNTPLSYERVYAQLSKFGSVPFNLTSLMIDMDEDINLPISEINALRRNACDMLIKVRENAHRDTARACSYGVIIGKTDENYSLSAEVFTYEQAKELLKHDIDILYAPRHVIEKLADYKGKTKLVTKLEAITNNEDAYKNIPTNTVMCSSLGSGHILSDKYDVFGDYRLNIYNESSIAFYLSNGFKGVTLSPELSIKDICSLSERARSACGVLVYGHIPLMTMKNCVIKSCTGKCQKGSEGFYLADRKKEHFPVVCQSDSCTNLLLNPKPTYMADKLDDLIKIGIKSFHLMFTVEKPDECARICNEYIRAMRGEKVENSMGENNFTRAHFYRGVL